uniref:Uncharacterized protein n=1 Tax=Pristionchus pacificus TaxID=54126 RepID=A0A2A6CVY0_PRIPA|eukprot:PDM82345.1 hypothetical protein PRIPAC_36738 [Pristionchus pacificus]
MGRVCSSKGRNRCEDDTEKCAENNDSGSQKTWRGKALQVAEQDANYQMIYYELHGGELFMDASHKHHSVEMISGFFVQDDSLLITPFTPIRQADRAWESERARVTVDTEVRARANGAGNNH